MSDTVSVNVIASAPVLADDEDTDGDGISDSEEGTGDSDGDNVPDYLDPIPDPSILLVNNDQQVLMSTVPSSRLSLGVSALQRGDHNISVPEDFLVSQGVTADMGYDFPVDLVDFVATGAESGYSYPIVYSLGENVIPENATYRKYMGDNLGWQDFVEDSANEVRSTYAEQGACPAASADNYNAGLVAGHNCVFLSIEDGGPNDADGEANGTLVDPSGIAVKYVGTPSLNSLVILNDDNLMADGTDTTTITVIVYDDQLVPLQHMNITGLSDFPGSVIGDFVEQDRGRYTAKLTVGGVAGSGPIKVVIDNGEVAITLISEKLLLYAVPVAKVSSGGGCTVATESNGDASLLLCLIMALLLRVRRRYQLT
ncbi:MAG TPA: hypothetical protein DCX08_00675 [Porticoccaceae bacterium]|nr:hypothetical protein [Porticoccaceae bacterium]